MKPVININFAKETNKEELRRKIESEVSNHAEDGVKYDKDTGIITVPDGDIKTVQKFWEIMGFKYPLEFMLARNSKGMEEAKKIYDSLCTYDRKYVQVLSSRTGCRINIHISPDRRDLLRKFLAAIYDGEKYSQDRVEFSLEAITARNKKKPPLIASHYKKQRGARYITRR